MKNLFDLITGKNREERMNYRVFLTSGKDLVFNNALMEVGREFLYFEEGGEDTAIRRGLIEYVKSKKP